MSQEGFKQAVMMHGVAMLPRLREMAWAQRMKCMTEAQEITLRTPVWMDATADKKKGMVYKVDSWSPECISGAQVIALMVFGLWVSVGESEENATGILVDWPDIPAYIKFYDAEPSTES